VHQFHRRSIRLKEYDYSAPGAYFVTICANDRKCVFGEIKRGTPILNDVGKMVTDYWTQLSKRFSNVQIDTFIVMPNHFHGIIIVGAGFPRPMDDEFNVRCLGRGDRDGRGDRAPTLGQIVAYFKYGTTKKINIACGTPGRRIWQRNYYDHIIRNEFDLNRIREYIINNPVQWPKDEYFVV
jgi:REP element-mobilizing transposase RayT